MKDDDQPGRVRLIEIPLQQIAASMVLGLPVSSAPGPQP